MEKLTITQAQNYDKKKDGSPLLDSKNRQRFRNVIKTNEYGDQFLSGFSYKQYSPGQTIMAVVTKEMYNGQEQLKFEEARASGPASPQASAAGMDMLNELKNHTVLLRGIQKTLEGIAMSLSTHQTIEAMKKPEASADLPNPEDEWAGTVDARTAPQEGVQVAGADDFDPLEGHDPFGSRM